MPVRHALAENWYTATQRSIHPSFPAINALCGWLQRGRVVLIDGQGAGHQLLAIARSRACDPVRRGYVRRATLQ